MNKNALFLVLALATLTNQVQAEKQYYSDVSTTIAFEIPKDAVEVIGTVDKSAYYFEDFKKVDLQKYNIIVAFSKEGSIVRQHSYAVPK